MAPHLVDAAMAEALNHLTNIASHFRKNGQFKAANELGKLGISIVHVFQQGIEDIPREHFTMDVAKSKTGPNHVDECSTLHNALQEQAVAALMNEVEKGARERATRENIAPRRTPSSDGQLSHPESWAQVAGSLSNNSMAPQETVHFMPPLFQGSISASKQSQHSGGSESDAHAQGAAPLGHPNLLPEAPEAKAGVIRVYGRVTKDIIQFITTRIHEGPLQDIRMETNGRTRVTFQHASQALAFLKSNQDMENMLGYGRFGYGYQVEMAEVIDWNDDHRRMNQPIRERRRLSFARKRLFADNMSPEKWKQDVRAVAGSGNIDFLWVFNSGNATAVFTNTPVARKVLDVFNKWKDGQTPYHGVSVTYSSDPCEKELILVKDTIRSNAAKYPMKRNIR